MERDQAEQKAVEQMNIPDNYDLWKARDREQEKMLARLPVCQRCKKPIRDDEYFDIYGEVLCEKCVRAKFAFQIEI